MPIMRNKKKVIAANFDMYVFACIYNKYVGMTDWFQYFITSKSKECKTLKMSLDNLPMSLSLT